MQFITHRISWNQSIAIFACILTLYTGTTIAATQAPNEQKQQQAETLAYTELSTYTEFLDCLNCNKYILVKFHADWCGGCKEVEPAFKEVAKKYADTIISISINIDNHSMYSKLQHHVDRGIPTIALLDQTGKEITKQIGSSDAQTLESLITRHTAKSKKSSKKQNSHDDSISLPIITTFDGYNNVLRHHRNVILVIYGEWCSPCKMFKPIVQQFSEKHPDVYCCLLSVDTIKQNSNLKQELASYAQDGIPATLFIQDGVIIQTITGSHPESSLENIAQQTLLPKKQSQTTHGSKQQSVEHPTDATQESTKKLSRREKRKERRRKKK